MTKTVVVALEFPASFKESSFEEQVAALINHIRTVCDALKDKEASADQWIIAWQEYGVTQGLPLKYITDLQKKILNLQVTPQVPATQG